IRIGAELKLLDLDDVLLSFGVVLFLFVLVLPLAVIDGLRYGRFGRRRDQDEVKTHFLSPADGLRGWHDLGGAIGEYGADFAGANRLVDIFPNPRPTRRKSGIHRWVSPWWAGQIII